MANVLVIAEQSGGHLRRATSNAISAGRALCQRTGGQLHLALPGKGVAPLAKELEAYGAAVHLADAPALEHYLAEAFAPVGAGIARGGPAVYLGAAGTALGQGPPGKRPSACPDSVEPADRRVGCRNASKRAEPGGFRARGRCAVEALAQQGFEHRR